MVFVEFSQVHFGATRSCPFIVDDFPTHERKRFQTNVRQVESFRVTVGCVCAAVRKSQDPFLTVATASSWLEQYTTWNQKKNVTSNRQSFVSASCKRRDPDHCTSSRKHLPSLCKRPAPIRERIQTTARQVERDTSDVECTHHSSQIRCRLNRKECTSCTVECVLHHTASVQIAPCNRKERH